MNDQVNFVAQKRVFALLRERSDAAKLMKGRPSIFIANRAHEDQAYLSGRLDASNKIGDVTGLPDGQLTTPGAESNFHNETSCFFGSSRTYSVAQLAMIGACSFSRTA